jgi:uncharacterized protein
MEQVTSPETSSVISDAGAGPAVSAPVGIPRGEVKGVASGLGTGFHVLAKPTGAICNLDCAYCFFLSKESLYPGSSFRMSGEVMESYIRQTIEAHSTPEVTIAWQGGEPTLMGLDFYRRVVETVEHFRRPGTSIRHTIQTNGILLDPEWCAFLREHHFLVGISLDGPRELHDRYRKDKGGQGTWYRVVKAVRLMQREGVEFNVLCTVNSANSGYPLAVYRFFRDELHARYLQFIPIVERINDNGLTVLQQGNRVTERSVQPDQYGRFLIEIFEEWVSHDVGRVFVQSIDAALAVWVTGTSPLCIFRPVCGNAVALEHNGDLYSCDHFVEPEYFLGNILQTPLVQLMSSDRQRKFGSDKQDTLPRYCRECQFLFECHGECPKNRFLTTPDGEPGLNYLCAGLKAYFAHVEPYMRVMSNLIAQRRPAAEIMDLVRIADTQTECAAPEGATGAA